MIILFKFMLSLIFLSVVVYSHDPVAGAQGADVSPEIVNELKDFEHLIPAAVVDAIVAEHYLVDGNFRTALKYLRGNEFTHLQKELLAVPEVIAVLDFLHMTVNATMHSNAAAAAASAQDEWAQASSSTVNDNGMDKIPTNAVTTGTGTEATSAIAMEIGTRDALAYKRPQLDELENTVDVSGADGGGGVASAEQQPLVDIVLLDAKLNTLQADDWQADSVTLDDGIAAGHHQHHHQHQQHPLGTFTTFVEEIIEQLPQPAYQHMIIDKCKKNAKFADFYQALRSAEFKPIVDEAMKTPNIQKILNTLNSHNIDVKSLEPIAFKVISWGPKV